MKKLEQFRSRPLGRMRYVYLDARYEKVRENGCVRDLAFFTAVGVNEDGYREILGISCGLSEAEVHWRNFLEDLLKRGLTGTELIISDDHSGLKKASNSRQLSKNLSTATSINLKIKEPFRHRLEKV